MFIPRHMKKDKFKYASMKMSVGGQYKIFYGSKIFALSRNNKNFYQTVLCPKTSKNLFFSNIRSKIRLEFFVKNLLV